MLLLLGSGGSGAPPTPVTGDPLTAQVLDSTPIVTSPTNLINPNGGVVAVTFKGMSTQLDGDATKVVLTVTGSGFDSAGAATTPTRTVTGTAMLRMPMAPQWVASTTVAATGDYIINYISAASARMYVATSAGTVGTTAPIHIAWVQATAFAAGATCVNQGHSYTTVAGGTTGTSPPVHTGGSASDGGVTWVFSANATNDALSDGGVSWRYLCNVTDNFPGSAWAASAAKKPGDRVYYTYGGVKHWYMSLTSATTGATPPTHVTGSASDGAVSWMYIGPPYITKVSGSDVIVYYVLDDYLYTGDTFTAVVSANAYSSSNASNPGILNGAACTNSSTLAQPVPHVSSITAPWQITSSGTLRCELAVFHPYGQSSRTAAAVRFIVRNAANPGAVVLTDSFLTSMTTSTILTAGNGANVQVFGTTLDISSLSDGLYVLEHETYPFIGAAYKSHTDGYGPVPTTASVTSTSVMTANESKCIPFQKDTGNTYGKVYAYVDSVAGNDATGTAHQTAATAATLPFATMSAARSTAVKGLQAVTNTVFSRNNVGNGEMRLVGSSGGAVVTYVGFHGSSNSMSSATLGNSWLIITRDPATTTTNADVAITPAASAALKTGCKRTKYYDITIGPSTASNSSLDNQFTSAADFGFETWFDKCVMSSNSTGSSQRVLARMGLLWITNSALSSAGAQLGNDSNSGLKLFGGCTITGTSTYSTIGACNAMGNAFSGGSVPAVINSANWFEGTGAAVRLQVSMWMFNTWFTCSSTPLVWKGTSTATTPLAGSYVMNITEVYGAAGPAASSKGAEICADSMTQPIGPVYVMWNTAVGDGYNVAYNENGLPTAAAPDSTSNVAKRALIKFNVLCDLNIKADWYQSTPERATQYRVGNFTSKYMVGSGYNMIYAITDLNASPKNISGDAFPTTNQSVQAVQTWSDDKSFIPANIGTPATTTGGGTYRPTGVNLAISMVSAANQMFPKDLGGNTRAVDGTGATGAYEHT